MKFTKTLIPSLLLAGVSITASQAATLYSQAFTGGSTSNLHGSANTGGTLSGTWDAISNFKQDGTNTGGNGSALLAFTPTSGMVYTLTATLSVVAGTGFVGIGFANPIATWKTEPDTRFTAASIGANPWMLRGSGGNQQSFAGGPSIANTNLAGSTLKIVLDTTAAAWKTSFFVNGTQAGSTQTYATNPTISTVGLTASSTGAKTFSDFSLTAVPEPSSVALLGMFGGLALLRRRR